MPVMLHIKSPAFGGLRCECDFNVNRMKKKRIRSIVDSDWFLEDGSPTNTLTGLAGTSTRTTVVVVVRLLIATVLR
jgi:hypothetical protein